MSHFYAKISQSARKTVPTARGHKNTGVESQLLTYEGGIETRLFHDPETGTDRFEVWHIPHPQTGRGARYRIHVGDIQGE